MVTLIDCPGCGRRLLLPPVFEEFWVQCPACAKTFVPGQLPPSEANTQEPALAADGPKAMSAYPALVADPGDEEEGIWRESFVNPRRDCEPHRGLLISVLGNASLIMGSMAMILCGVPGLLGLPLGVAAWLMGNHDLKLMHRGLMDPDGFRKTRDGRESGILGVMLSAVFLAGYALFLLALHPF
jgi:hypothetical protein